MKDFYVLLVVSVVTGFALRYVYQIRKHEITPALSTWIIFLVGMGLSLITYAIAEKHDFRSGIFNTMDVVAVIVVLVSLLIWGDRKVRFKPFEKWYLIGAGLIIAYGIVSGNAWRSNVFTQVLMSFAYLPTFQKLITSKRNTESFTGWGCVLLAGFFALYPALVGGNTLAVIYATRNILFVAILLVVMTYFELKKP